MGGSKPDGAARGFATGGPAGLCHPGAWRRAKMEISSAHASCSTETWLPAQTQDRGQQGVLSTRLGVAEGGSYGILPSDTAVGGKNASTVRYAFHRDALGFAIDLWSLTEYLLSQRPIEHAAHEKDMVMSSRSLARI